jgi:hypothetical protein
VVVHIQLNNQHDAWKRVKDADMVAERTVTEYWQAEGGAFPLVKAQALRLAAVAASGADIERVFSEGRANFDYFMGAIATPVLSDRLCAHVNSRLLDRFGFA